MKSKVIVLIVAAVFLLGSLGLYFFTPLGKALRVNSCGYKVAITAQPAQVVANGTDKATITVNLSSYKSRRTSSASVASQTVYFSTNLGQFSQSVGTTDSNGASQTSLTSTQAGTAYVTINVNGCEASTSVIFAAANSGDTGSSGSGTQLFADDFSAGLAKWIEVYNGYGTVTTQNGYLLMSPKASTQVSETHAPLVAAGDTSWTNYQLTLRMNTLQQLRTGSTPNSWEVGWVLFRYKDASNFYYLIYKPNGVEFGKLVNGVQKFLATTESPKMAIGSWDNYKIVAVNNNFKVYINGTQVIDFTDTSTPFLNGKIGLYNEDAKVYYDDVVVTGI